MRSICIALLLTCSLTASAQFRPAVQPSKTFDPQTEPDSAAREPEIETKGSAFFELETDDGSIERQLDLLVKNYHYGKPTSSRHDTILLNTHNFRADEVPQYTAPVIQQRLAQIPALIAMDYNEHVQRYIDLYTLRRRDQVSRMMGLSRVYFPMFEEYLDRAGMPMELKYLPVVESALNPYAVSRVGATGLWQFMLGTAKVYGLRVDSYVDERRDPSKSTLAAIRYLQKSYEEFGDWLLAIASYNCGPGNVRKAILRSGGGKRSFWEIMPYLPAETRGYVPAFIAATYAFEYASEHNIYPLYVDFGLDQDTVHLTRMDISLPEIAQMTGTSLDLLRNLNPELKIDRIPYSSEPYVLRVPSKVGEYFAQYPATLRSQFGQNRNLNPAVAAPSTAAAPARSSSPSTSSGTRSNTKLIYHTVRSGEVVGGIAEKYHVTPRQIADWNHLRRYQIKVGQKLKIYVPASQRSRSASAAAEESPVQRTASTSSTLVHTVRAGETLWAIANQYPGVEVSDLLARNSGLDARNLKVGQVIRIR